MPLSATMFDAERLVEIVQHFETIDAFEALHAANRLAIAASILRDAEAIAALDEATERLIGMFVATSSRDAWPELLWGWPGLPRHVRCSTSGSARILARTLAVMVPEFDERRTPAWLEVVLRPFATNDEPWLNLRGFAALAARGWTAAPDPRSAPRPPDH